MTRIALGGMAVAGLMAIPGVALAASRQYNGPTATGVHAGVEFGTRLVDGRPVTVRRFRWFNLPAQCMGYGPTAANDTLASTFAVSAKRRFHVATTINGSKVKVVGRFSSDFRKATGTIRVSGSVPGCSSADTGTLRWTAPAVSEPRRPQRTHHA